MSASPLRLQGASGPTGSESVGRTALPTASPRRTRAYAWSLVTAHSGRVAAAALLSAAAAVTSLAVPELLGQITNLLARHAAAGRLDTRVGVIGLALLVQGAFTWSAARVAHTTGELVLARVRDDFLANAVGLPLDTIERAGTGDLLTRATLDARVVDQSIRNAVPQLLTNLVTITVILIGALATAPVLAATVIVVLPVLIPSGRWYLRRSPKAFAAVQARLGDLAAVVAETADGAETVEALGWQERRVNRTEEEIVRAYEAQRRVFRLRSVFFPVLDSSIFLPCLTTLALGSVLAAHGDLTIGQVVATSLLMQMLTAPAVGLVFNLELTQQATASLARLVGAAGPRRPLTRSRNEPSGSAVRLRGVRFGYDPDREVLHGVDLDVRPGERLALVGPTGAGKSTLGRIIAGIHVPNAGTVTVGGVSLAEFDISDLRRVVVMTVQEQHVFAGTLADNIRLAAPDADEARLVQALGDVGAAQWLDSLPGGLETELGGRRRELPPAVVQQIALARLLLANPEVVVLDEATSMLSPHAARTVEASLSRVLAGRTVVSIAHRLQSACDADRIAVVDRGAIVEVGSHAELMELGGLYVRLWATQNRAPAGGALYPGS